MIESTVKKRELEEKEGDSFHSIKAIRKEEAKEGISRDIKHINHTTADQKAEEKARDTKDHSQGSATTAE